MTGLLYKSLSLHLLSIVVTNPTICRQPYVGVDAFEIRNCSRALSCEMALCPSVFLLEDLGGCISSVSASTSVTWDIVTLTPEARVHELRGPERGLAHKCTLSDRQQRESHLPGVGSGGWPVYRSPSL